MKITLTNLQKKVEVSGRKIKNLIRKVLAGEKVKKTGWINICFVDDPRIRELNSRFLNHKNSTDVLAFNLTDQKEKDIILADIMISAQTALKQARIFETTPEYELSLYLVHGILHILGYNDRTALEKKQMRKKESQYVN
ncbi:MAG: rRNA maturation RNase YbeY [Candidatus Omnitrophica bacterium CG11_big_fil_rev_8_21_14_0_20_43_6]|nr:MAG: rRNA maturation RNase YbeY [Candidatus Omnitrophica bacterium CG11_big_fil_rev_8_21_14_0_20_43_6]